MALCWSIWSTIFCHCSPDLGFEHRPRLIQLLLDRYFKKTFLPFVPFYFILGNRCKISLFEVTSVQMFTFFWTWTSLRFSWGSCSIIYYIFFIYFIQVSIALTRLSSFGGKQDFNIQWWAWKLKLNFLSVEMNIAWKKYRQKRVLRSEITKSSNLRPQIDIGGNSQRHEMKKA